ncbi:toprim domain-containing protein [Cetobacterium sp.]|uniref:toprim domain-containing protein n=1 Tax=Cetobacterium sp. TaxID=2071632 RepID=UPI003F37F83D
MQHEIVQLKETIKANFTLQYAYEMGLDVSDKKKFHCLCKDHNDSNPSMSFNKKTGTFHCFSCGKNYDAFNIAHDHEGKPLFSDETVFYLAEKFGVPYKHLQKEYTPEDKKRQEYYRTVSVFATYVLNHKNMEYLDKRNITVETADKLGIGSVDSYKNLEKYLLDNGCNRDIIKDIGINAYHINENKLIFILKNEYNYPVSFGCREMIYTKDRLKKNIEWKEEYNSLKKDELYNKISKDSGLPVDIVTKYIDTEKYVNGKTTCIFEKSQYLYMWGDIKKEYNSVLPLLLCEGYMDCISAYQKGFKNIVGICSTSFTDKHLMFIEKETKIEKVTFALDSDEAGKKKTNFILEKLKENKPLLKEYSFAIYKEDGKDIDEIINTKDIKSLKDIFSFKSIFDYELLVLQEKFGDNLDEDTLYKKFIEIIAKTKTAMEREKQVNSLMEYLPSYSKTTVLESISEIVNEKEKAYNKEVLAKVNMSFNAIKVNPKEATTILGLLNEDLTDVDEKFSIKKKSIRERSLEAYSSIEVDKQNADLFEVKFNFPWLNDVDLNLGNSVVISSLANIGKSSIFQFLGKMVSLDNSNNVAVLYVTTDDTSKKVWENMIACISGLPRNYCSNPYYHKRFGINRHSDLKSKEYFDLYTKTSDFLKQMQNDGRLMILDVAEGMDEWLKVHATMKELANDPFFKKKFKIMIVDSVNNITVPGISDENATVAFLSSEIKKKSQNYGFLSFLNFELNKLRDNSRLSQFALSGTKKIFYNCDLLGFVYNPSRNLKEQEGTERETKMTWDYKGTKQPIIVTVQDKTKVGNNEMVAKPYFYKLNTFNNVMEAIELGSEEHLKYQKIWLYEWENYYKTYVSK